MNASPHADARDGARARDHHPSRAPDARRRRLPAAHSGVVTRCRNIARIARVSLALARARTRTVESPSSTVVTVAALAPHPILARPTRAS